MKVEKREKNTKKKGERKEKGQRMGDENGLALTRFKFSDLSSYAEC